jgi:hypothetical protein
MRQAAAYLLEAVKPGFRIDGDFLQTQLKPARWTREVLDQVTESLVARGVLLRRGPRFLEVNSLSDVERLQVRELCIGPFASIASLYETSAHVSDGLKRTAELLKALETCSRGHDYAKGEGCVEMVAHDEFGDIIRRWGYHQVAEVGHASPAASRSTLPVKRRKISISRLLIDVAYSPLASDMISTDDESNVLSTVDSSMMSPG